MNTLCNLAKQYGPLFGRVLLANIFIVAGFNKIIGFAGTAGYMASKGLPMPEALLVLTITVELGGGLMVLLGWQARWGALAIFLWLIPVTLIFHAYWDLEPAQMVEQQRHFMKNLAVMGGMMYIVAFGPGAFSLGKDKC